MAYPTIAVKVSLSTDRYDTPSYTTLPAADLDKLDIEHGRHSELDGSDPGTLSATLYNDDRTYDPRNASGTYYPNLVPGKKTQVVATYDATAGATSITYVGAGSAVVSDNGLVGPGLPAGWQAGDLFVVMASIRNSGTGTLTPSAGWSTLVSSGNVFILGRIAQAGDTLPLILPVGGAAGDTVIAQCFAFRGTDDDITTVVHNSAAQLNGSAQDIAYPALTVSTAGCAVVAFGWKQDDWTSVATLSGWAEASDSPQTTGNDAGQVVDYQIQTSVAGTNISSGSFTVTGGASAISRGIVLALKPYRGTKYEIFNGWSVGWPNAYGARTGSATLKALGPFQFLQRAKIPDPYQAAVLADSPVAYYRLGDAEAHTIIDSSGNGLHGHWWPDWTSIDTADGLVVSDDKAVKLKGQPAVQLGKLPAAVIPSLRPLSVEFWIEMEKLPQALTEGLYLGNEVFSTVIGPNGGVNIRVWADTGSYPGAVDFLVVDSPDPSVWRIAEATNVAATTGGHTWGPVPGNGKVHLVCTINSAGDDMFIWFSANDGTRTLAFTGGTINAVPAWDMVTVNWAAGWDGDVVIDELAFYDVELSESQVYDHWLAGALPGIYDMTGERIDRALDLITWPASLRDLDTGQTTLGIATGMAGTQALDYLDVVTATEQGILSEAHDDTGKLRFQGRAERLTDSRSSTVQTLFSDDATDIASSSAVVYSEIDLATDDRPAANTVTVKWAGGEVVDIDDASVDAYGEIPVTVETLLTDVNEATSLADWILAEQSALFTRVRSITLRPSAMNGTAANRAWVAALSRKVGDRVRVVHKPASTGTAIDQHLTVIGVEHHAANGVEEWDTVLHFSPAISLAYWILGTGQLDSTTVLAY